MVIYTNYIENIKYQSVITVGIICVKAKGNKRALKLTINSYKRVEVNL